MQEKSQHFQHLKYWKFPFGFKLWLQQRMESNRVWVMFKLPGVYIVVYTPGNSQGNYGTQHWYLKRWIPCLFLCHSCLTTLESGFFFLTIWQSDESPTGTIFCIISVKIVILTEERPLGKGKANLEGQLWSAGRCGMAWQHPGAHWLEPMGGGDMGRTWRALARFHIKSFCWSQWEISAAQKILLNSRTLSEDE